ncbi:transcriptional regulator TbsP [Halopenitus sp. H-Gu1]|uniref:transcriptional regulator TbsP n=1 Tax=Halopenitus sp. H-Gu1 TaxID=3242697 RepID=UPI00359CC733
MASSLLESDLEGILSSAFSSADELVVVDPSVDTIVSIADADVDWEDTPRLLVLADEDVLKEALETFPVASTIAELLDREALSIRTLEAPVENSLFVSENRVLAIVGTDDRIAALSTDEAEFVDAVASSYWDRFEDAPAYRIRTPAIGRVRETMAEALGTEMQEDFDAVLSAVASGDVDESVLDAVTIALLVAARNEVLLYDLSKWGEDVGIASKATFSRTKTSLEDHGLIDTEKVPIDVGRPRLRLKIGDDRLRDLPPDRFAATAADILS